MPTDRSRAYRDADRCAFATEATTDTDLVEGCERARLKRSIRPALDRRTAVPMP